jgi:hypothetical protein
MAAQRLIIEPDTRVTSVRTLHYSFVYTSIGLRNPGATDAAVDETPKRRGALNPSSPRTEGKSSGRSLRCLAVSLRACTRA